MYQINMRNTLHLHNVICQLYLILEKRKRKCSSFWEEAKDNGWAKKLATFFLVGVAMLEIYMYAHSKLESGRIRIQASRVNVCLGKSLHFFWPELFNLQNARLVLKFKSP